MLDEHGPVEAELPRLREVDRGDGKNGDQHGEAAHDGIDQEFERRIDPPTFAPGTDEEVERNQHRLPEDIEENQVERQQDAGGGGLQDEEQQDELLKARRARVGDGDRDQEEQR